VIIIYLLEINTISVPTVFTKTKCNLSFFSINLLYNTGKLYNLHFKPYITNIKTIYYMHNQYPKEILRYSIYNDYIEVAI